MIRTVERKIGIRELARQVGVSTATISNAFNRPQLVKPETRRRIVAAAKRSNYRPHRIAHALKTKRTQQLGLIAPTLANHFYTDVVRSAQIAAWNHGFDLVLTSFDDWSIDQEIRACDQLMSMQVDGVVMLRRSSLQHDQHLREMIDNDIKMVLVDDSSILVEGMSGLDVDMVEGTRLAVDHLLQLGHRRLMLVTPTTEHAQEHDRRRLPRGRHTGIQIALEQARIDEVAIEHLRPPSTEIDDIYRTVRQRLAKGDIPTAVLGSNDQTAATAMAALMDAGMRVPRDVSVVGFDNTPYTRIVRPALTTVSQSHLDLGCQAIEMLIESIRQPDQPPRQVVLAPELVIRDSTGPVPQGE